MAKSVRERVETWWIIANVVILCIGFLIAYLQSANKFVAIRDFCYAVGLWFLLGVVQAICTGNAYLLRRHGPTNRNKEPLTYWAGIILTLFVAFAFFEAASFSARHIALLSFLALPSRSAVTSRSPAIARSG